jgi:hypothetical protein
MSDLSGLTIVRRPFAIWPPTLQIMPDGLLDVALGRFFVAVTIANSGAQAWPTTQLSLSTRCRQRLLSTGVTVDDLWAPTDSAVFDQRVSNGAVSIPALNPNQTYTAYFKLDVSKARPGCYILEVELKDPASPSMDPAIPSIVARATSRIFVSRTSFNARCRTFTSVCDKGKITAAISSATVDSETFRRALARARAVLGPSAPAFQQRSPLQLEKLKSRWRQFLCGDENDLDGIIAALKAYSALPSAPTTLGSGSPTTLDGWVVFSDQQSTYLGDRVTTAGGGVGSNRYVELGAVAVITGDVVSGGDAFLRDSAKVYGTVTVAGVVNRQNNISVSGGITEHAPYSSRPIPSKSVTPGSTDVTVAGGSNKTLQPGTYRDLHAYASSTLSLSSGVYHFNTFVLEPDVTLKFDVSAGAVDIRTAGQISFADRTKFAVTGGPSPRLIQFYSNQTGELRIGTDIPTFRGQVTAPAAVIHVYSRTVVDGSLWASGVRMEPDTAISQSVVDDWSAPAGWAAGKGLSGFEFLAFPTDIEYSIEYDVPFFGQVGPLPYDAVPWKTLVISMNLVLSLLLTAAAVCQLAEVADDLVIGKVKTAILNALTSAPSSPPGPTQTGSVDAAVLTLSGNRTLGCCNLALLDADPAEANAVPVAALGGRICLPGTCVTNAELNTMIANAASDPGALQVYKSGAGSGVTRALIAGLIPVFQRTDGSQNLYFLNQVSIVPDAASPSADGKVAGAGDSGALWIQTRTNKVVALNHAVGPGGAVASRIEDVINALGIQLG